MRKALELAVTGDSITGEEAYRLGMVNYCVDKDDIDEFTRVFAERILREGDDSPDARLDFAFRQAVSHRPDGFERKVLRGLLESNQTHYQTNRQAAEELIRTGQAETGADIDVIDLAAWTAVARAILNMNETITRN